jgi:hypothetical protein
MSVTQRRDDTTVIPPPVNDEALRRLSGFNTAVVDAGIATWTIDTAVAAAPVLAAAIHANAMIQATAARANQMIAGLTPNATLATASINMTNLFVPINMTNLFSAVAANTTLTKHHGFEMLTMPRDLISHWWESSNDPVQSHIADEIVTEIGRLKPGWAGPESVRPSEDTLDDIARVIGYLPPPFRRPLIEIDELEGDVTLSWISEDRKRMFSLHFHGNHNVIGSYTSLESGESLAPWKFGIAEESKITSNIDNDKIRALLSR